MGENVAETNNTDVGFFCLYVTAKFYTGAMFENGLVAGFLNNGGRRITPM